MHYALMLSLICGAGVACSSSNDPFTTGDGTASVQGLVTTSSGTPLASTTVLVDCQGSAPVATTTGASGVYLVNLTAPAAVLDIRGSRISCRFTEPDPTTPRAQVDTALGFARGPVLVALQMVDLHEH
jgi:hypothetical protein